MLSSRSYVFDPRPRLPLRTVAKRYWVGKCPDVIDGRSQKDALTLVFLHGIGAHKEHWEPTIQRLFQRQQANPGGPVRIHDAWSIDMQSHGDSAILNEQVLRWGYDTFVWETYGRGVHAFLAGLGTGVDVDFSKRKLVIAGHSLGAMVGILLTTYYPLLRISSLYLFEPSLTSEGLQDQFVGYAEIVEKRRDIWPSAEEAFRTLRMRPVMSTWDERLVKVLAEHGLRPLPTAEYPDLKEGVTLKCPKRQEGAAFRDIMTYTVAWRYLPHVLKEVPTHIVFGEVSDVVPEERQQEALHTASGGISNFASVTRVPGAGHMILQTHPDATADVMWKLLNQSYKMHTKETVLAKL